MDVSSKHNTHFDRNQKCYTGQTSEKPGPVTGNILTRLPCLCMKPIIIAICAMHLQYYYGHAVTDVLC